MLEEHFKMKTHDEHGAHVADVEVDEHAPEIFLEVADRTGSGSKPITAVAILTQDETLCLAASLALAAGEMHLSRLILQHREED